LLRRKRGRKREVALDLCSPKKNSQARQKEKRRGKKKKMEQFWEKTQEPQFAMLRCRKGRPRKERRGGKGRKFFVNF